MKHKNSFELFEYWTEKRGKRAWDPRSYHVSTASQRVMVAATLEVPEGVGGPIRQLSVAFLFAETIRRISDGESVTSLFAEQNSNF